MRTAIVGIVLAVLVVASLGVGYLTGTSSRQTITLTSITTLTSSIASTLTSISMSTQIIQHTTTFTTTVSTAASNTTIGSPIPIASVETASVSVGGYPRTIAVNPNASRIYVADMFSDILTVIDVSSHRIVATVPLPANNNGIAIDQTTGTVYVLLEGGVAEINGSTNQIVGELPFDFGPGGLAYDPTTHILYGSTMGKMVNLTTSGNLVGVDVRTRSVVANISLGYWADSVATNPNNHMVYAAGCTNDFVCGTEVAVVNGTTKALVNIVRLNSGSYPRLAVDLNTNVVYVSGDQFVALYGNDGSVIYSVNARVCGAIDSMTIIPSLDQVLAISPAYEYLMVYDGANGTLVNMYSFPQTLQYVAFNPNTAETYITLGGQLVAFHNIASYGHVNSTLIGSDLHCLP